MLGVVIKLCLPKAGLASAATRQQERAVKQVLVENKVNGVVLVNGHGQQARVISNEQTTNQDKQVHANRLFPVASLQKLMTGIAVLTLVNDNKLALTSPLSVYQPRLPYANKITVNRLMTHMSGLHTKREEIKHPLIGEGAQRKYALAHVNSTGKFKWHYDDLDFVMLAAIIHWTSHQSYRHYLTSRVLRPAGVRVRFYDQVQQQQVPQLLTEKGQWSSLQLAMSKELGSGEIFCTPLAYWQFFHRALLDQPSRLAQFMQGRVGSGETYFGGMYLEGPYLHANGYLKGYSCTFYSNYHTRQTIMLFANNLSYRQLRKINPQLHHAYYGDWRREQKKINAY